MGFWPDWVWWLTLGIAVISFGMSSRPGTVVAAPVKTIGRAVFILVVALAFIRTGWPGGLAVCLGGGLGGLLLPVLASPILIKPTPAASREARKAGNPAQRLNPVPPSMGRLAVLRDMAQNGISRAKVRQMIYHGRLLAFEDPQDGKVTLIRPEDLEAMGQDPKELENEGPR